MPGDYTPQEIQSLISGLDARYRLIRYWPLTGGVSARIAAIEVATGQNELAHFVARLHGQWERQHDPDIAEHEFRLLNVLHAAGLPVTAPIAIDDGSCEAPVLIVEYLPGEAPYSPSAAPRDPEPMVRQLAQVLLTIHRMDTSKLTFLPDYLDAANTWLSETPAAPNEVFSERAILAALDSVWPPPDNGGRLLHGDFWPGNLLFEDGELKGVLDWEEAALGDPLADLAIARLELTWLWGAEAAEVFTDCYRAGAEVDLAGLLLWDLFAALRMARGIPHWGFSAADWQLARAGHAVFTRKVLLAIGGRSTR